MHTTVTILKPLTDESTGRVTPAGSTLVVGEDALKILTDGGYLAIEKPAKKAAKSEKDTAATTAPATDL